MSEANRNLESIKRDIGEVAGTAKEGYSQSFDLAGTLKALTKTIDKLSTSDARSKLGGVSEIARAGQEQAGVVTGRLAAEVEGRSSYHAQNALRMSHHVVGLMGEERFTEGPERQGVQVYVHEIGSDLQEIEGLLGALREKVDLTTAKARAMGYNFIGIGGENWKDRTLDFLFPPNAPPLIEKGGDWVSKIQTEITEFQQELNR